MCHQSSGVGGDAEKSLGISRRAGTTRGGVSRSLRDTLALLLASASVGILSAHAATDGIWTGPGAEWTTGTNWSSTPTVPDNTATFDNNGAPTSVVISTSTSINVIQFNAGAPAYSFSVGAPTTFDVSGAGINNSSSNAPGFTNSGMIRFFNSSTAGNATFTNNSTLQFFNSSSAGVSTITNNSFLQFLNSSTGASAIINNTFALQFGDSSTAGSATITNALGASTTFSSSSTAGNASITNNGNLQFTSSSTADSATVTTNGGATTQFFDTSSGGQARFITNGGGVVDISNITSAGTTAGSIEGAGTYFLDSHSLTVGGNDLSTTVSGVLSDGGSAGGTGGSLVKVGSGTLTLSGTNAYTGGTTVNAGTLLVDGSIALSSGLDVNAGGTVGGTGTLPTTRINAGGTLSPGGSIGVITVQGDLMFAPTASYNVEVSSSTADRTDVTGAATIAGTVQATFLASNLQSSYSILSAVGGRTGTFGTLTPVGLPSGFSANLSYTATDVLLNLTATLGGGGAGGLTQNQQNVSNSINSFFNNGGTLAPGFGSLFNLSGANLGNSLAALSGEASTGAQQGAFQLTHQFLTFLIDPLVNGRSGADDAAGGALGFAPQRVTLPDEIALAYAKALKAPVGHAPTSEHRWTAWGGAYGGTNRASGDPVAVGSHDLTARTGGIAVGVDYRGPGTVLGFALGGGGTNWSLAQDLGGGRSDAFQAGIYGAIHSGAAYVAAAFTYANHWVSTDRFAFAADHVTADFSAQSIGGRIEGGYRLGSLTSAVTPYWAAQSQLLHMPSYRENDLTGGGFALAYNERNATGTRTELGSRFDQQIQVHRDAVLALQQRVAWAHDWASDPTVTASFQTLPGASFIVNGAPPAKNAALASASLELRLRNGVSLRTKLDGEFASHSTTYAGSGMLRYVW